MNLPKELIDSAKNNNLVVFVGAGLSINFINNNGNSIGSWMNLVKQIVNYFSEKEYFTQLLESSIQQGENALDVLNRLEILSKLSEREFYEYSKYYFHTRNLNDSDLLDKIHDLNRPIPKDLVVDYVMNFCTLKETNNWSLHENICKISNLIITTNYDNAFELTADQSNISFKTILIDDEIPSEKFTENELILFKLHGSVLRPKSMVIFPEDYAHLYEHRHHSILSFLKKILIKKNILFIGCGMGDWQINNIFMKTKDILADTSQSHFIITREKDFSVNKTKLESFLTPIYVTDFLGNENKYWDDITEIIEFLVNSKKINKLQKDINYLHQANKLFDIAIIDKDETNLNKCCELYSKASFSLKDRSGLLYSNWGTILMYLAKLNKSEELYLQSIEKFKIAIELEPNSELFSHNLDVADEALWRLNVKEIIERNIKYNLEFIPVKVCLGSGDNDCFTINSVDRLNCKRCGNLLGENWNDQGHVSGAICNKCKKYVGTIGVGCMSCGKVVPQFYEDF